MIRQIKLATILLLVLGLQLAAQDMPPGNFPTTTPTTVPTDRQSPRGALKIMASAMARGDANALRESVYAGTPAEEKMRSAMADFSAAIVRLRNVLEKSFGKAEAAQLTGDMEGVLEENNRRVDEATETINGNDATVSIADPGQPGQRTVRMKKNEGGWQIVMEDNGQAVNPEVMDAKAEELNVRAGALAEAAAELEQGNTSRTFEQVTQAIQAKMMAAMQRKAQTQPSTQATTQPAQPREGHDHAGH